MPNNTAIMVSFAACFALRLSSQIAAAGTTTTSSSAAGPAAAHIAALAPSVRTLVEELSDVLDKIGNITRHRNGMCGLYARYLRILVRKAAAETGGGVAGAAVRGGGGGGLGTAFGRQQMFAETSAASTSRLANFGGGGGGALNGGGHGGLNSVGAFGVPQPPPTHGMPVYEQAAGGSGPSWGSVGGEGGGGDGAELFQFSSMSGDQIVEALSRAGGEFDPGNGGVGMFGAGGLGGGVAGGAGGANGGFGWDEAVGLDFLPAWNTWPDFGF